MSISTSNHRLPPPSPIPRARGSRSAANAPLSDYIDNTLHCPELTLPDSHHLPPISHMLVPAEIEYRSLSARIDAAVRSVKEFGAFRIRGHGITAQELRKMEEEAQVAATWNNGCDVIPCVRSRHGSLQFIASSKSFGLHSHPNFWIPMGKVASRADSIVEQLRGALRELKQRIEDTEWVISLCRHPHGGNNHRETEDYALRFYLPLQHCIFYVQSVRGPLSFDAGPDTIVVTLGKQLQEWSHGELKSVAAEMIFISGFHSKQASLSLELKLFRSFNNCQKILSFSDQILILLFLSFLCNIFSSFVFSY